MIAVILENFGGPRTENEIVPFLKDIFRNVLPRQLRGLAPIFAAVRARRARKMYAAIGGASPVTAWTTWQGAELQKRLGGGYKVYVGMRYGTPSIRSAVQDATDDGADKTIHLPLYPYRSIHTRLGRQWHNEPLYLRAITSVIAQALAEWKDVPRTDINIVFSAHALPFRDCEPYLTDLRESANAIAANFVGCNFYLSFQSAPFKLGWTGPSLKSVLKDISGHTLIVPLGFACENLETLHELDKVVIPAAERLWITNIKRTPALNDSPQFIDLLAKLVLESH
jgi:ferrochelatase